MIEITDEMVREAQLAMEAHSWAPAYAAVVAVAPLIEAQVREQCAKAIIDEANDHHKKASATKWTDYAHGYATGLEEASAIAREVPASSKTRSDCGPTEPETGFAK